MSFLSSLLVCFCAASALVKAHAHPAEQIEFGTGTSRSTRLTNFDTDGQGYNTYFAANSAHKIRIKQQNDTICDARSDQYTGWLDIGHNHLFFWYFKSQGSPSSDPLTLWQTGGPGGSSLLGMMQELGPCLVNDHGNGTVHNPYGWSKNSNLIFIDQPAGVGFSYVDPGHPIPGDSFTAAKDLHAFFQIFVSQVFPELANTPFHISGESYAGHYTPILGSTIISQNLLNPNDIQINLKSILVGNAWVSPHNTVFGYWETLCTTNPGVKEPVFNTTRCDIMAANLPRCIEVTKICYDHPDPALCHAAEEVCWDGVVKYYDGESYAGGRNRFDITAPCYVDEFCYASTLHLIEYFRLPYIISALSIPDVPHRHKNGTITYGPIKWSPSSAKVERSFMKTNDFGISAEPNVRYLLESGLVDVMFYQGNLDLACNTAGNRKFTDNMPWSGQSAFYAKRLQPWKANGPEGKTVTAGTFKEVRKVVPRAYEFANTSGHEAKATRFAFVTVDNAGHMVPQDQPEIALDLFERWIKGEDFGKEW